MELKFCAKGDLLVTRPGFRPTTGGGAVPEYVGREFVPANGDAAAKHPASSKPFAVAASSDDARRLQKRCRRGELLAFDEATARACGVPFAPVEFKDGEWSVKSPAAPAAKPKSAKED
jgi:hypothetical protein